VGSIGDSWQQQWHVLQALVDCLRAAASTIGSSGVILLLLWLIWKARNALIFDEETSTATDIIRRRLKSLIFIAAASRSLVVVWMLGVLFWLLASNCLLSGFFAETSVISTWYTR